MAPAASFTPKPVPDTFTKVPFGPDFGSIVAVGAPAAAASEESGAAIAMSSNAVSTATVVFLNDNLLKLLIFYFLQYDLIPFFHRAMTTYWSLAI
jgi:hypothetical protein